MPRIAALIVTGLVLAAPAVATPSRVQVSFVQPERYTDAALYGGYGEKARAPALTGIRQYLEKLGQRYLKPDQALTIEVLDIDLAGQFEPWRALSYDVRYLGDITWPRMNVRYTLTQGGATIASGEETISDMAYLMTGGSRLDSDSLRYEKTMLDDWFRVRFAKDQPARG